jgi:hypothetical protein
VASVIFETLLGVHFEIVVVNIHDFDYTKIIQAKTPVLFYGIPSPLLPSIPSHGLLFENGISDIKVSVADEEFPKLLFPSAPVNGYTIDFDLFSAAFYLLTSYFDYKTGNGTNHSLDEHGRYNEKSNPLFSKGYHRQPLVDVYAQYLWQKIHFFFPQLTRKENVFDYRISFDIDSPYLFKNKSLLVTLGSLAKKTLRLQFVDLARQVKTQLGGRDPYDVFDYIVAKVPNEKLLFFFLLASHHANDTRITYKKKAYRALIKNISTAGIETGIHPSYTSFKNASKIAFETAQLQTIIGQPVQNARMHFLKYALPETFEYLIKSGIRNDYTLCPLYSTGFKNFISRPFLWFDITTNSATTLLLHPTMVMDRSLQKYMGLGPEQAWQEIKTVIDKTREYNGTFTILFHNSTLSETAEWKGWKSVFEKTADYLSAI